MEPAVFLDRDGTINKDKDYLYRIGEFEYIDGAVEGLKELSDLGYKLIIITNQSGIARGYYTEDDYDVLMNWMIDDLADRGVYITAHYYCPHLAGSGIEKYDVECDCRKPKTGLFHKAVNDYGIDLDRSYAIGDRLRDLAICEETNVRGILLGGRETDVKGGFQYIRCQDWDEIVDIIKRESGKESGIVDGL